MFIFVILQKSGIPASELREHLFILRSSDATRHLFEVSAGLDSLVLGEGQILAQVKQVVRSGQNSGGLGKNIDRMFKDAITAGKRVRSETNISSGAVSVSSAAVELALMKLPKSEALSARMLLIGAGKMGKLVIKHLIAKDARRWLWSTVQWKGWMQSVRRRKMRLCTGRSQRCMKLQL